MKGIRTIVFDFDGVFVSDSDAVFKPEGYGVIFHNYGDRYRSFLNEAHKKFASGKKGGRQEIIGYVLEKLGEPKGQIPRLVQQANSVFDAHVQQRIRDAGLVPGAKVMLEALSSLGLALYLNSSTATAALELAAQNLQISRFFRKTLGSTNKSKVDNLRDISVWEKVSPAEILCVGDGDADIRSAREFGSPFVGVSNRWNRWEAKPFPVINYLPDLLNHLDK